MVALTGSKRKYVIIAIAALVFIIGLVLIYMQHDNLVALREEIEEEKIAVEAAEAHLNRLETHQERANEYRKRLDFARSKIPEHPREEEVLRYLQRLADQHRLRAVEINFAQRVEEEGFTALPFNLTIEGNYSNIRKLLHNLRSGDRAFRVDNLRLSRAEGGGSDLRVLITASTFYRP